MTSSRKSRATYASTRMWQDLTCPLKKIVFTLMLIKGPDTIGWTRDMGDFLDGLRPVDNIPDLWMQFLEEFGQQF
jgi:hypothetical protein